MRASMQAMTATPRAGGSGSGPLNVSAYRWLFASSSSVTDMARVSFPWSWRVAPDGLEHRKPARRPGGFPLNLLNFDRLNQLLVRGRTLRLPRPGGDTDQGMSFPPASRCRVNRDMGGGTAGRFRPRLPWGWTGR